jgi:glutamate transport system ATP-binding protein
MMSPKILLLDEITSALDPVLTLEVLQAIRQLREQGLAMLLVTHHIEFASSVCDRIVFLSQGQILQEDTPDNLRRHPASDEVKNFLEILRAIQ